MFTTKAEETQEQKVLGCVLALLVIPAATLTQAALVYFAVLWHLAALGIPTFTYTQALAAVIVWGALRGGRPGKDERTLLHLSVLGLGTIALLWGLIGLLWLLK